MSREQEIILIIANAAEEVGDKPFAAALSRLAEELNECPSYMHFAILHDAWGKEKQNAE